MILGLDIGYSNLVVAHGASGEPVVETRSAVAGEESRYAIGFNSGPSSKPLSSEKPIKVVVDDNRWLVGVEARKINGWSRQLHQDYPSSKLYEALFKAALLMSESNAVERLVTGLPCNQVMDDKIRKSLQTRLTGTHQVSPKVSVEVKETVVVPQPTGAYTSALSSAKSQEEVDILSEGKVVVFDPGYFSVDWCEIVGGALSKDMVGASLNAMSRVLEMTADAIQDDYGALPEVESLEEALRKGNDTILFRGVRLEFNSYLKVAARKNAEAALVQLRQQFRSKDMNFDALVLAGGGGSLYREAIGSVFGEIPVFAAPDSVQANALGFWYMGQ